MDRLTPKEEEIMLILWHKKQAFVKEIVQEFSDPKPHYNTISTLIRILEDKGFVAHHSFGRSHQYFPVVSQDDYKKKFLSSMVDNYFGSFQNLLSFYAKKENLTKHQLNEIIQLIENEQS